jgi:5-methylcytosine-specific restriction enzyme subunit McrC
MQSKGKYIRVFEHQSIKINQVIDGVVFDSSDLKAFHTYYGDQSVPYFSLIHQGVRFNEYVGVIQIGSTIVEVLPKADNRFAGSHEKKQWKDILIDMLIAVGIFTIHAPSSSSLKLKPNSILDLYFELFIQEVEYLLHRGLVKRYQSKEGNVNALKGSLQFSRHLQQNLTHQERFYVRYTVYDSEHILHCILYKTIQLLKQINTHSALHGRIGALLLSFPEMPEVRVTESTFDRIVYNRKTQSYQHAISIARLLLLQYHPDVNRGKHHVLALMFDMNKLWEQFVYESLRKHKDPTTKIRAQASKYFWKPESGSRSAIRPDIVVNTDSGCVVLDAKWKNLYGNRPSPEDLRQMYVYHTYYGAQKVALVYPGIQSEKIAGTYLDPSTNKPSMMQCGLIYISVEPNIRKWQERIAETFKSWLE